MLPITDQLNPSTEPNMLTISQLEEWSSETGAEPIYVELATTSHAMSALVAIKDYVLHVDHLTLALLLNQLMRSKSKTPAVHIPPSIMLLLAASMVANMLTISQLEELLSAMSAERTFAVRLLTAHAMFAQDATRVCVLDVDKTINKGLYLLKLFKRLI
jgi:hypothetical protein